MKKTEMLMTVTVARNEVTVTFVRGKTNSSVAMKKKNGAWVSTVKDSVIKKRMKAVFKDRIGYDEEEVFDNLSRSGFEVHDMLLLGES